MKQIPVRQLKPGMVTASDVITKRGQLIAQKGTALTSQLIARLSFYRIESVDIDMPEEEKPAPQPEAPAVSPEQMEKDRQGVLAALDKALGEPRDSMFPKMPEPVFPVEETPAPAPEKKPEPKEEHTYIKESVEYSGT